MSELSLILKGNDVFDLNNNRIGFITSASLKQDHPKLAESPFVTDGNGNKTYFQQGTPTYRLDLQLIINRPDLMAIHPGERKEIGEASKPTKARKIRV